IPRRSPVASTDSLLDAHEVAVRARVEELREQAARVATELGEAELALEHVAITKATLAVVLAGGGHAGDGPDGDAAERQAAPERAAVPPWSVGLDGRALPAGYQELWAVLVNAPDGVRCKAAAVALGLEPVPKKVEGVRSKMRRLVRRGWAVEATPGLFQTAAGPTAAVQ
ncbi:MAG TPA: hypothetical protein VKO83_07735, partial [Steroidobacteraceae bacterium]|nr:hypothetical protein [Steroidobacteraceae bacterium]